MLYPSFRFCLIVRKKCILLLTRSFLSTWAFLFPFIFAYLKPNPCKVFQSVYFDTFKEWVFSKVTWNFLIETYSFFEKNQTTTLLIKSLSKLSKESLHLFTDFLLSSTGSSFNILFRNEQLMSRACTILSMTFFHA